MQNKTNIPPTVVPSVAASGTAPTAQVTVPAALSSNSDQNTIALPTSVPPVLPESAALPENAGAEITPSTTLITSDTASSKVAEVTAVADGISAVPGTVVLSSTAPTEVAAVTAVAGADLVVDAEDELIFLSEEAVAIEIAKLGNGPAPLLNKMEMQTQTGNGKRLYFWFRGQLFRDDADVWYFFNGQKWKAAKPRMLYLLFQKMAQKMMEVEVPYRLQLLKELVSSTGAPAAVPDAAAGGKDPNEGVYYPSYTFAKALLEPSTANTALQAASYLMTKTVKLDGNLELMNLVNGTINLKTGTFLKHNKNDYLSKMINIKYDPHAVCPVFDRVVSEYFAGDPEEIRFFQKVLGYIISGRNDLKLLFVFLGVQGGEGKSLIGALLRHIFLEYSATMAIGALAHKGAKNGGGHGGSDIHPELFAFENNNFVFISEPSVSTRLADGTVKTMTSGCDQMTTRGPNGMPRTFMPQATVVIPTNSNLVVNDQDKPMLNRIFIVLFRHQVVNPDGDLLARLVANEQPGIFNWLAIGAKRCYEEGLGDNPFVKYSAEIQKKVKTRVTVTVEGFVKDFCDTDDRLTVSGADLLCAYTEYQAQEFDSNPDLSATAMGEALGKAGFISREDRSRKPSVTMRCGIQLNAAGKALLASYNAKLYVESPPTGSVDGSSAETIEKVGAAQSVAEKAEAPKAKRTSKTGKKDSKK